MRDSEEGIKCSSGDYVVVKISENPFYETHFLQAALDLLENHHRIITHINVRSSIYACNFRSSSRFFSLSTFILVLYQSYRFSFIDLYAYDTKTYTSNHD